MIRITGVRVLNRLVIAGSLVALAAAVPALAEEGPSAQPSASPSANPAPAEQLAPGETPVPVIATPPPPAVEPMPANATETPAVPASDPVLAAVRAHLLFKSNADKADIAAMTAFYAARTEPLWVRASAYTPAAAAATTALRNADDWGLEAKSFALPELATSANTDAQALAEIALTTAALKYAHQASGGRIDPSTLSRFNDQRGTFADPSVVLTQLAASTKPNAVLEGLHPQHIQFQRLHEALVTLRHGTAPTEPAAAEPAHLALANGPALKPGTEHADIAAIRAHLKVAASPGKEAVYDGPLVAAVKAFQDEHGLKANGVISNSTRSALNGGEAKSKPHAEGDRTQQIDRIVLNMERWRWLPADMAAFHIENNIPEYQTRVFQDGRIVHQEKIIVGKTDTPTPVFTANMLFVIFHPEWGVPDGIKVKEIWPSLRRKTTSDGDFFGFGGTVSDTSILRRHNLRVSYNGRPIDASQVDWTTADPRAYQFIQPAGGQNVLGVVKFRFPNRHDVYMHDTPQRELFNQSARALSHGCMRVHNPQRLAEVILAHDRGWSTDKVAGMIAGSGTNEVKLETPFPVHVTYFTARVEDDGKLHTFADLYGQDAKLASALAGHSVKLEDPAGASAGSEGMAEVSKPRRIARKGNAPLSPDSGLGGILSGLFGN